MSNQRRTEMVRAVDLKVGDHVMLSDQLTVVLTDVGYVDLFPLLLTQLTFSEINGMGKMTVPNNVIFPRVVRKPAVRMYKVIGQVFSCDSYENVITASSPEAAEAIARDYVNEDWANLHEFCINEVTEVED
jgi:hypothetical protein